MLCPASREVHEQANPPIPACSCVMQETHRLGCVWDASLEGHSNDNRGQFYPLPQLSSKYPCRTVLNWDILLRLLFLSGCDSSPSRWMSEGTTHLEKGVRCGDSVH